MKKGIVPLWSKKAQKKLIDREMSKKELAAEVKVNYTQLCNVLNGVVYDERVQEKICTYLGL